jgi:hypothetical protein
MKDEYKSASDDFDDDDIPSGWNLKIAALVIAVIIAITIYMEAC